MTTPTLAQLGRDLQRLVDAQLDNCPCDPDDQCDECLDAGRFAREAGYQLASLVTKVFGFDGVEDSEWAQRARQRACRILKTGAEQ